MGADATVRDAHLTLKRAASFIQTNGCRIAHSQPSDEMLRLRRRVIGNCLRELDRFLCVLIENTGAARDGNASPRRGAAVMLTTLTGPPGEYAKAGSRLRALRRSFNCLVFTSGLVTRGDQRGSRIMSTGWWSDPQQTVLRRVAVGEHMNVDAVDLMDATAFYMQLGDIAVSSRCRQ